MSYEKARALINKGNSRPTLYSVSIPRVLNTANFSASANDYLDFFVKSTTIPEISHETVGAAGQSAVGIIRQQPMLTTYGKPFDITVLERSDFIVYRNLKDWFSRTCPNSNNIIIASNRMGYYDNITADIVLTKFEYGYETFKSGKRQRDAIRKGDITSSGYRKICETVFENAYVTSIGSIQLGSEMTDTPTEFNVQFNYEKYYQVFDVKS